MNAPHFRFFSQVLRIFLVLAVTFPLAFLAAQPASAATHFGIPGPSGSGAFGTEIDVLPNGNIVVTDPLYDFNGVQNIGAVYLYDGSSGDLISVITGSTADDQVGSDGVYVLENGNYVICSSHWRRSGVVDVGAVTWAHQDNGVNGSVSAANSLVGTSILDAVGAQGVVGLTNGNYVVANPFWNYGGMADLGAVTWGNGTTGISGDITPFNSLVGSIALDRVGENDIYILENGNYVVISQSWDNGAAVDAGAVTWADGLTGIVGPVSAANSLVGSTTNDQVGSAHITELLNSNYVVLSPTWDNPGTQNAGAATFADGDTGISGTISSLNSLVGTSVDDQVGYYGAMSLTNNNYVVFSPYWDFGSTQDAGAVTWGNGTTGTSGAVSIANSLVGGSDFDMLGQGGYSLFNGNYVVMSPYWDNGGIVNAGAATWANGTTGLAGLVSAANSLVGANVDDRVGLGGGARLSNGNYVVSSPDAQVNGVQQAGAATWGNGATGTVGTVSALNSLVGTTFADRVSSDGVWDLSNGNYIVLSPDWDSNGVVNAGAATFASGQTGIVGSVSVANSLVGSSPNDRVGREVAYLSNGNFVVQSWEWNNGAALDAGAVTLGNGVTGVKGVVSAANSLVGSTSQDAVGEYGVIDLFGGNYVVCTPYWDNGLVADAGAVTWGDGVAGVQGTVSAANSLVGGSSTDQLCSSGIFRLGNGDYFVRSPSWSNGGTLNAGAVTYGFGHGPFIGAVDPHNSVLGSLQNGGGTMRSEYDPVNKQLVVSLPLQNQLILYRAYYDVYLPVLIK